MLGCGNTRQFFASKLLQFVRHYALKMSELKSKRPRLISGKDKSYFDSYCDITVHEEMLGDGERTNKYKNAIFACGEKIKDKVVLDVGAGTGILSCFCAQAGAKKVYAVEASKIAEQAKKVVKANGFETVVDVIHGMVEEVSLPEKVDVIVSEWMGYCLLYESMLTSVIIARDRWLKPGGIILPDAASIYIVPVCDDEIMVEKVNFWNDMDEVYGVDMNCIIPFARESLAKEVMVKTVSCESMLSREHKISDFNLYTVTSKDLQTVGCDFDFSSFGIADLQGFAVWFDVHFLSIKNNDESNHNLDNGKISNGEIKTITLSTSPYKPETHWKQSILYFNNEIEIMQDSKITGSICLKPEKYNPRFLSVLLKSSIDGRPEIINKYSMGYELPKGESENIPKD